MYVCYAFTLDMYTYMYIFASYMYVTILYTKVQTNQLNENMLIKFSK